MGLSNTQLTADKIQVQGTCEPACKKRMFQCPCPKSAAVALNNINPTYQYAGSRQSQSAELLFLHFFHLLGAFMQLVLGMTPDAAPTPAAVTGGKPPTAPRPSAPGARRLSFDSCTGQCPPTHKATASQHVDFTICLLLMLAECTADCIMTCGLQNLPATHAGLS